VRMRYQAKKAGLQCRRQAPGFGRRIHPIEEPYYSRAVRPLIPGDSPKAVLSKHARLRQGRYSSRSCNERDVLRPEPLGTALGVQFGLRPKQSGGRYFAVCKRRVLNGRSVSIFISLL
jgi:hypothetical protein